MSGKMGPLHGLQRWWRELPAATSMPLWPAVLAVLVIVALLLGFHQLVRDAVHQGEALRLAASTPQVALRHCDALRTQHIRERCMAALNPASSSYGMTPPPNTAIQQSAGAGG